MSLQEYAYYKTYYDKEQLRRAFILLQEKNINFQTVDHSGKGSSRAPLSMYIEVDIKIRMDQFEEAYQMLEKNM